MGKYGVFMPFFYKKLVLKMKMCKTIDKEYPNIDKYICYQNLEYIFESVFPGNMVLYRYNMRHN